LNNPDIEIYIKETNCSEINDWLENNFQFVHFEQLNNETFFKGKIINGAVSLKTNADNTNIPVVITPHAAGKKFCSVWFKSDKTLWPNDEACANSFLAMHDTEVRCSANSWTEKEEKDSEQWLCLSQNDKKLIHWG